MLSRPARWYLVMGLVLAVGTGRGWTQGSMPMNPPPMSAPIPPDFRYNNMPMPQMPDEDPAGQPRLVARRAPDYPLEVQALGIEGKVKVSFTVTTNGMVTDVYVVGSPSPVLSELARKAVAGWIFEPARLGGTPINALVRQEVKFNLPWRGQAKALAKLPPDGPAKPIYQSVPDYPVDAATLGEDGQVIVDFKLGVDGRVQDAKAVRSTNRVFEAPAVEAVSRWVLLPPRVGGKLQAAHLQVPVVFTMPPELKARLAMKNTVDIGVPFAPPATTAPPAPAKPAWSMLPVYPFAALLDNRRATVDGAVVFDADGHAGKVQWAEPAPPEEFARAVEAMLAARGAESPALHGRQTLHFVFDPHDGDVRVSNSAAAILKRLRLEGPAATFTAAGALDAPLEALAHGLAVAPAGAAPAAEVTVEFFVDEAGRAVLPHVAADVDPVLGAAACQAVAGWRFKPPVAKGEPTVVRRREPVVFAVTP